MRTRLFLPLALAVIGMILAACGVDPGAGATATPTPTETPATPTPQPTFTPTPTGGPLDAMCLTTLAMATGPLKAVIGWDQVPSAFDAVNSGGCDFTKPIVKLTIVLDGPGGKQTVDIPFDSPVDHVNFPLSEDLPVPTIDAALTPGVYERTVTAYTADGESKVIGGFQSVELVDGNTEAQTNLDAAKADWQTSGPSSYRFTVNWQCFCMLQPVIVEVHDGQMTSVTYADPQQTGEVEFADRYGTMDKMFGYVQDAIDNDAAHITAEYDPTLGYPTHVFIDQSLSMADEEMGFTITDFETL